MQRVEFLEAIKRGGTTTLGRMKQPPHPPEGFVTALAAAAQQAHELFTALQEAGFTEEQAMRIVIGVLRGGED